MPSDHYAEFEQTDETYVAVLDGVEVARSSEVVLLREHYKGKEAPAVPYFPRDSVDMESLTKTDKTTVCPIKGSASYWTCGKAENSVWSYEHPVEGVEPIAGHFAFDTSKGFEIKTTE